MIPNPRIVAAHESTVFFHLGPLAGTRITLPRSRKALLVALSRSKGVRLAELLSGALAPLVDEGRAIVDFNRESKS